VSHGGYGCDGAYDDRGNEGNTVMVVVVVE
jgi:hypothetical protein